MTDQYTVSDGKLILRLEAAPEGGYLVTSPMEPALNTQAETLTEAFEMARDAIEELRRFRADRGGDADTQRESA